MPIYAGSNIVTLGNIPSAFVGFDRVLGDGTNHPGTIPEDDLLVRWQADYGITLDGTDVVSWEASYVSGSLSPGLTTLTPTSSLISGSTYPKQVVAGPVADSPIYVSSDSEFNNQPTVFFTSSDAYYQTSTALFTGAVESGSAAQLQNEEQFSQVLIFKPLLPTSSLLPGDTDYYVIRFDARFTGSRAVEIPSFDPTTGDQVQAGTYNILNYNENGTLTGRVYNHRTTEYTTGTNLSTEVSSDITASSNPQVWISQADYSLPVSSSWGEGYLDDGVNVMTDYLNEKEAFNPGLAGGSFMIGTGQTTFSWQSDRRSQAMKVAEILFYKRLLTDADREAIQYYASTKYGI